MGITAVLDYDDENPDIILRIKPEPSKEQKEKIDHYWKNIVARKILIALSKEDLNLLDLQKKIGHSYSTTHSTATKLEKAGLISSTFSFKGAKQKIVRTNVLAYSKERYIIDGFRWYIKFIKATFNGEYDKAKEEIYKALERKDNFMSIDEIKDETGIDRPIIQWVIDVEKESKELKSEGYYNLDDEGVRWLDKRREKSGKKK